MIQLTIKSPQKTLFAGQCQSIILPGIDGQFQLLNDHCAIMAQLTSGEVNILTGDGEKTNVSIAGGFLNFANNQGSLLAD